MLPKSVRIIHSSVTKNSSQHVPPEAYTFSLQLRQLTQASPQSISKQHTISTDPIHMSYYGLPLDLGITKTERV